MYLLMYMFMWSIWLHPVCSETRRRHKDNTNKTGGKTCHTTYELCLLTIGHSRKVLHAVSNRVFTGAGGEAAAGWDSKQPLQRRHQDDHWPDV